MFCSHCAKAQATLECKKCAKIYYCGFECGKENWDAFHKFECIGMKRNREELLSKYDPNEKVILVSKEGKSIEITVSEAANSTTITNFIEENGTNTPIELKYIRYYVLNHIVGYMKSGLVDTKKASYQMFILLILAANYLDVHYEDDNLVRKLCNILLRNWSKVLETEKRKNSGFTDAEQLLVNSRDSHLKDIHIQPIRNNPDDFNDYGLVDLPKSVIEYYLFEGPSNFKQWFNDLLIFRAINVYFWHVTTNFIIKKTRERYFVYLKDFSDEQVYQIAEYHTRPHDENRLLSTYALKGSDIPAGKSIKTMEEIEILAIAVKRHGSVVSMEFAVDRLNASKDRERQKKTDIRQEEENRKETIRLNKENILNYVRKLGYTGFGTTIPEVFTYRIDRFENDPFVKEFIAELDKMIKNTLNPLDFKRLSGLVDSVKLNQILFTMDPSNELKSDRERDERLEFLKKYGYILSNTELREYDVFNIHQVANIVAQKYTIHGVGYEEVRIHTTPEMFARLLTAKNEELKKTQETLRLMGYNVNVRMIYDNNFDVSKIVNQINSSSLVVIRDNTISWEAFLNVLRQK